MALIFERISASQLQGLPRHQTVFFFPIGPMEDHGPHLPLGLDLLEAERLAQMISERMEKALPGWQAVLMPRIPLGVESNTTALAVTVRGYVLRDWLVDTCHSLARIGFRQFVCFSGNLGPKQLTAIEDAAKLLRLRAGGGWVRRLFRRGGLSPILVSASSALLDKEGIRESLWWNDPKEHGGERDTSVALCIAPESVDPAFSALPSVEKDLSSWIRLQKRFQRKTSGYWGKPDVALAEKGRRELDRQVDEVFTKLRAVWEGANPDALFRSWFSIVPIHRTFFKAWFLGLTVFSLLMAWVYLSFRMMVD